MHISQNFLRPGWHGKKSGVLADSSHIHTPFCFDFQMKLSSGGLAKHSADPVNECKCKALLAQQRGELCKSSRPAVSGFSQPGLLISLIGLGNYPQDPSAYGPTRPSHSYGQDEQGGYSAGRCQHRLLQPQK